MTEEVDQSCRLLPAANSVPIPLVSRSPLCIYAGCNRCDIAINPRDACHAQHRGLAPAGVTHLGRDPHHLRSD